MYNDRYRSQFMLRKNRGDGSYEAYINQAAEDPMVLMQYTGIKDKNGKEIYEGDVVKEEHYVEPSEYIGDSYSKVVFEDKGWKLVYVGGQDGFYKSFKRSEVVGNIYEDEHLLNKK